MLCQRLVNEPMATGLTTAGQAHTTSGAMARHPVMQSIQPVTERSRFVHTDERKIAQHAAYLAYEELPIWPWRAPYLIAEDSRKTIDFFLLLNTINFAFTDFQRHVPFQTEYRGVVWSDAEAMIACLRRALERKIPILEGAYLAEVTRPELQKIFRGNIEMPLLDERVKILNEVGQVLSQRYQGHFYNFIEDCPPKAFDRGRGIVERLVKEFPSFNDQSPYQGRTVKFYKRAQLAVWMLYGRLRDTGLFRLNDPDQLTAFADYILPAALHLKGILRYHKKLETAILTRRLIPAHSPEEVEIRAHTIYACRRLTEEINKRRRPDRQIIVAQLDARLWTHFHTTDWPHHLTITTAY